MGGVGASVPNSQGFLVGTKNSLAEFGAVNPAAGATYVGPWHDSLLDGTLQASVSIYFQFTGAIVGQVFSTLIVDVADDTASGRMDQSLNETIFTQGLGQRDTTPQIQRFDIPIRSRYWRVRWTNGAGTTQTVAIFSTTTNFVYPSVDSSRVQLVSTEGQKNTYRYPFVVAGVAGGSTFPSITLFAGSSTLSTNLIVKIVKIRVSITTTVAAAVELLIAKSTTLWFGGASIIQTIFSHDSQNPLSGVEVRTWNPAPTGGGTLQYFAGENLISAGTSTVLQSGNNYFDQTFGDGVGRQPFILRGQNEGIGIIVNVLCSLSGFIEWTEE